MHTLANGNHESTKQHTRLFISYSVYICMYGRDYTSHFDGYIHHGYENIKGKAKQT